MCFLRQTAVVSTVVMSTFAQLTTQQITNQFHGSLSQGAEIYFPSDPDWTNETTQRWTVYPPTVPVYLAAIKPATAEDVSSIVKIANQYNISYLAIGGGHGLSTTLGRLNDGVDIDLSNFQNVTIDKNENTVTVGGGTKFGNVIAPVYEAGYEIVTGACPCVGAVGASIGGGISRLQGLHGMIVDNVVSFKVVTAKGDILNVSDTQNPDLFWAMRGAGHNFGIVLEVTFKLHPVSNGGKALNADMVLPANKSHEYWKLLKKLAAELPAELSITSGIQHSSEYGLSIYFNAVYYGPEDKGRQVLAPFFALDPLRQNATYIDAQDVFSAALFGNLGEDSPTCQKGNSVNVYTVGLKDIDLPTLNQGFKDMATFYDKYPTARSTVAQFELLPIQAVKAVPDGLTAYPSSHREIVMQTLWQFIYDDPSIETGVTKFAQASRNKFHNASGFDKLALYTTYAHGDEGAEVWYAESLPRLQSLKRKYDSLNKFRFFNPVNN